MSRDGIPLIAARLAERLNVTPPTVTATLQRMERDGLIHHGAAQGDPVHRRRPTVRRGHRAPPRVGRATADRPAQNAVARVARGGARRRARHDAQARSAVAGRARQSDDLPARQPDPRFGHAQPRRVPARPGPDRRRIDHPAHHRRGRGRPAADALPAGARRGPGRAHAGARSVRVQRLCWCSTAPKARSRSDCRSRAKLRARRA